MDIIVINGSPSGSRGITSHSIQYLQAQFPQHRFEEIEVARRIHRIERDADLLDAIVEQMAQADAIVWAYPVYVMLVSAQLKRFVELLFERADRSAFAGKIATSLSTSAHHYDHTAHDYMASISCDLGMEYVRGFSAGSRDLTTEKGRHDLMGFAREFLLYAEGEASPDAPVPPVVPSDVVFDPQMPPSVPEHGERRIVVISDAGPQDANLTRMIEVFERSVSLPVDRLDLAELDLKGGCLGCMACFDSGVCSYKDGYQATFEQLVLPADVVIYAGSVRDRYLSARFKTFIDRYFNNGHRPVQKGAAMGFLISGPLQQLPVLREILEAHVETAMCQRLGIVTDEDPDIDATTRRLQGLARSVDRWAENPWHTPPTFLGVGAAKNFRDLIYTHKGIMSADHRYYRDEGLYDFPQKDWRSRLFQRFLLILRKLPWLRDKLARQMRSGHTRAQRRVLEAPASA